MGYTKKYMNRHTNVIQSAGSAIKGTKHGLVGRNFRILLFFAIVAIFLTFYFPITATERYIIITLVAVVLAGELFNTSIEELADVLIQEHHPGIARVKELAAGAMLFLVTAAAIIGLYIFIPYF